MARFPSSTRRGRLRAIPGSDVESTPYAGDRMKSALFVALGIITFVFVALWLAEYARARRERAAPDLRDTFVGLITNFFDTLGIGSFATTTSFFKLWRMVPDDEIPGTLNIGHTIPSVLQAFIYITIIRVDVT